MKRYIVACKVRNKDNQKEEGYLIQDFLKSIWIPTDKMENKNLKILVFENLSEAEKYLDYLRKTNKQRFKNMAKKINVPYSDFGFWLKKLDSSTTPITLVEDCSEKLRKEFTKEYPTVKYYSFKPKTNILY